MNLVNRRLQVREADLVRAERVLKEELGRRTWTELELSLRRNGDPQGVEIVRQLRAHDHNVEMDRATP